MSETTSTEVAIRTGGALAVGSDQTAWTEQQLAVLRSVGVSEEVTKAELDVFLHECQRTRLDPFSKQIYLIGRYDNQLRRKAFRSQTGIDGYRVVAHRVAREDKAELEYEETLWCGPDGKWRDLWIWDKPPLAAKVVVLKNGKRYPAVATLAEYAATDRDGNLTSMWRRMPANQLEKCAEAKALRRAFPNDLGGIYTAEEMEQADAGDSRPQEISVEQAAGRMRRNKGRQADDEWVTDPGAVSLDADAEKPSSAMLQRIAILITGKFGSLKREDRLAHLSKLVGRKLGSSKDISLAEARAAVDALEALPDHIADAEIVPDDGPLPPHERSGDRPVPAATAAALWAPTLEKVIGRSQGAEGKPVAEQLAALIEDAPTPEHINRVGGLAVEARDGGHLAPEQFDALAKLVQARREALGLVGDEAPTAEQYEARDALERRARRASTPDDFNAVYGAMVDAEAAARITKVQQAALTRTLDARYEQAKARWEQQSQPAADAGGEGWSHRRLAEMTGARS